MNEVPPRHEASSPGDAPGKPQTRRRRWMLFVGVGVLVLVAAILGLPVVIAKTGLRNAALAEVLSQPGMEVEAEAAELGWVSPVVLKRVKARCPSQRLKVSVGQIRTEKSWPELWWTAPKIGSINLDEPQIEIVIQNLIRRETGAKSQGAAAPTFSAQIENGSVLVRSLELNDPIMELESLDIEAAIENVSGQSVLTLGRTQFMDHYPMSQDLCREGLQLIAPVVADAAEVEGSVSLELAHFRLALNGRDKLTKIDGLLQLHDVRTQIKSPVLQETIGDLAKLFEFEMPNRIELARDAVIPFAVRNDRVHHKNIRFTAPALTGDREWRSDGSVGFDESLDLTIWAPIPLKAISDSALARVLSEEPLELHIAGTIQEPIVEMPEDSAFANQLSEALLGSDEDALEVEEILDRAEVVLETGEAAAPILQWGYDWWQGIQE